MYAKNRNVYKYYRLRMCSLIVLPFLGPSQHHLQQKYIWFPTAIITNKLSERYMVKCCNMTFSKFAIANFSLILPCVMAAERISTWPRSDWHSLSLSRLSVILEISPERQAVSRHSLSRRATDYFDSVASSSSQCSLPSPVSPSNTLWIFT